MIADDFDVNNNGDPMYSLADQVVELALIGSVLLEPPVMDTIGDLAPSDFFFARHRQIFQKMRDLWESGSSIDIILIADRDPELTVICTDAYQSCPSSLHVADYARQVRNLAQKRRLLALAQDLVVKSVNGLGADDIYDYLQKEIDSRQPLQPMSFFERWHGQGITAAEAARIGMIERPYVVRDLIRGTSVTIIFGAPGEFKSALTMDMGFCIANGIPWLQPLPVEGNVQKAFETSKGRILWLNYDQGHDDVVERLGAMARVYGGGENVTAISHSSPPAILLNEAQARGLGEWCGKQAYRVVIIDSLLDVKGKADLQEAAMGDLLRLWRVVAETGNLSVVIIAHNTKASLDLYGSQFIKAKVDHLYYVSRPPGTDVAIFEAKKQRNFGEQNKVFARFTYQHFNGTRTLETARFFGDSTENRPAHPNNRTQSAILRILMESPGHGFLVNDLTDILNEGRDDDDAIDTDAVRSAANRLVDNERNVGKTKVDGKVNLYHYGELALNGESE